MDRSESKYFITAGKMDEAFIELLDEKDFEYISVKEICAKAGVNRSTFYLHYESIGDLLNESIEYLDAQFFSYFKEDGTDFVSRIPQMDPEELNFINAHFLVPYLNYIKDNRRVFKATLKRPDTLRADERYRKLYKYIVDPVLEKYGIPAEKRNYYNVFFVNGMIAVINVWLKDDCRETPEEISELIENLVNR